jgi:glycosyltransferase involved in cell wall biosynthesis
MKKENLVILNNEKIFKENNKYYCENLDLKIVPEGLNNFFNVKFIARSSPQKGGQELNLLNISVSRNILEFLKNLFKTFNHKNKYLIISITPYTFIASLFLLIFRKKIYLYLWSDGKEEWKHLIGSWSVWIYQAMYEICSSFSELIVCNPRLTRKKSHLISISRLDEEWKTNSKKISCDSAKFLYVGRISKEKGIFDFMEIFNNNNLEGSLTLVGNSKNFKPDKPQIIYLGYVSDDKTLRGVYDNHNITILPSYTEGYPYVVDESLARIRPVIIFEEISYVVNNKKGIFVCKRNAESVVKTTNYILNNYDKIQKEIRENNLPTKKSMLKQISDIINN